MQRIPRLQSPYMYKATLVSVAGGRFCGRIPASLRSALCSLLRNFCCACRAFNSYIKTFCFFSASRLGWPGWHVVSAELSFFYTLYTTETFGDTESSWHNPQLRPPHSRCRRSASRSCFDSRRAMCVALRVARMRLCCAELSFYFYTLYTCLETYRDPLESSGDNPHI